MLRTTIIMMLLISIGFTGCVPIPQDGEAKRQIERDRDDGDSGGSGGGSSGGSGGGGGGPGGGGGY